MGIVSCNADLIVLREFPLFLRGFTPAQWGKNTTISIEKLTNNRVVLSW
jgi:hypothetical protein